MPDSQTLTWVWVTAAIVVVALASFLIWWFTKKECTTDENCKNNKTGTFCDVKVNKCVAKECTTKFQLRGWSIDGINNAVESMKHTVPVDLIYVLPNQQGTLYLAQDGDMVKIVNEEMKTTGHFDGQLKDFNPKSWYTYSTNSPIIENSISGYINEPNPNCN